MLQHAFLSPARRRETPSRGEPDKETAPAPLRRPDSNQARPRPSAAGKDPQVEVTPKRRRSFDRHAWQSISQLRTSPIRSSKAAEALRHEELSPLSTGGRSRSGTFNLDGDFDVAAASERALRYGNTVQVFDLIQKALATLRQEALRSLRVATRCTRSDLFLMSSKTQELLCNVKGAWYRLPSNLGLPGHCVMTSETLNVDDVQKDDRYDSSFDDHFRIKTRNVLCGSIRGKRGGGEIVGVLALSNKEKGANFTQVL